MPEAIVREAFQTQAQACDALGSLFTARALPAARRKLIARKAPLPTPSSHGPAHPVLGDDLVPLCRTAVPARAGSFKPYRSDDGTSRRPTLVCLPARLSWSTRPSSSSG